jgi:hypothetical protein
VENIVFIKIDLADIKAILHHFMFLIKDGLDHYFG